MKKHYLWLLLALFWRLDVDMVKATILLLTCCQLLQFVVGCSSMGRPVLDWLFTSKSYELEPVGLRAPRQFPKLPLHTAQSALTNTLHSAT